MRVEGGGDTLVITLTRPDRLNALDAQMRDELVDALALAAADPGITRVEWRGEGRSFCAGGDLDEFGTRPDPASAHLVRLQRSVGRSLAGLDKPIVTYLHGPCMGSGIELAAFTGTVVGSPDTTLALPEIGLGLVPGAGGTVSLTRRIGRLHTACARLLRRADRRDDGDGMGAGRSGRALTRSPLRSHSASTRDVAPTLAGSTLVAMTSTSGPGHSHTPAPPHAQRARGAAAANDPFPGVEKVRPGLWSVPVPLPNNSLRYVLVYVFETDRGPYLMDAGWNTDDAFNALQSGLDEVGCDVADVQGVMVTHIHPDHYGLAGRIRQASGAWISLHPADAELIHDRYDEPDDLLDRVAAALRRMGAPPEELEPLRNAAMPVRPLVDPVLPDVLLEDGAQPEVPGWDLTAIWTPGHSPGHLCFYEARHELMLSGDHVLPRITPNIPFHPQAGANPLGDYLASLDKLEPYDVNEVLPAHEYRFDDLRKRLEELRQHHRDRFTEVIAILSEGPHTAWDIASHMRWSRSWDDIAGFMRRAAVGETVSHLRALEIDGVVQVDEGEPSIVVARRRNGRTADALSASATASGLAA